MGEVGLAGGHVAPAARERVGQPPVESAGQPLGHRDLHAVVGDLADVDRCVDPADEFPDLADEGIHAAQVAGGERGIANTGVQVHQHVLVALLGPDVVHADTPSVAPICRS